MKYQTLTDDALLDLLSKGKVAAYETIYERYWKMLYAVAYGQVGSKEDAEDIVHNVFEKIWTRREHHTIPCLKAYLIVSVRHFAINFIKSQLNYRKFQEYLLFQEIQKNASTDDIINYAELQQVLNEVLQKLPEKTLEVFRMSRYEQKSVSEIAHHFNMTEKAVEYHITKSLKFIKVHLDMYFNHN